MPSPTLILAVLLAVSVACCGFLFKEYTWAKEDGASEKQARVDLIATVKVAGDAQNKRAADTKAADELRKKEADAEHEKTVSDLTTKLASLRRSRADRASSGYLSPAAPGSTSPQTACVNRADTERAIRDFVEGSGGLVEEGDRAIIDLNTAKAWSQGQQH